MDKNKKTIIIVAVVIGGISLVCCVIGVGVMWLENIAENTKLSESDQEAFVDAIGDALEDDIDNDADEVDYVYDNEEEDYYYSSDLPTPPTGYSWTTCHNMDSSFLKPNGWYKSEETDEGTEACFLTKESYYGDEIFETGLSINMVENIELVANKKPSKYAYIFINAIAEKYDGELSKIDMGDGFDAYGTTVILSQGSSTITVYYLAIGVDEADKVYTMWFESPTDEWYGSWPTGQTMLNNLGITK